VEKYSIAGQTDVENMAHARFSLRKEDYKHTLKICNIYRFSTATMVVRTSFHFTF